MTDQLRFLGVYHRDQLLVIRTAAASPARRQWRKRSYIATAKLAPQSLHPADAGSLAAQVAAGVVEAMAGAAGDPVPQIDVPATLTAQRTLKPWTADAFHWFVPRD